MFFGCFATRFRATLYPCPDSPAERREMLSGVIGRISDIEVVLQQTAQHRSDLLNTIAANISAWMAKVSEALWSGPFAYDTLELI